MGIISKLFSKMRASLYLFKKAEILKNVVNKEIGGEYDNLCHTCYFNERYHERAKLEGMFQPDTGLRISIYLGGALGDYIVYLRFVDEISSICACSVDLFLDRIEFAMYVYGDRKNITIIHDAQNCLFNNSYMEYDLAVHLDHGLTLKHCNLGAIREKAPDFYVTACKITEYARAHQLNIANQSERESVILRRAKFLGETKWSKLSCGGAVDMDAMYSNLLLNPDLLPVLDRYQVRDQPYITVNFGADRNMGGTAQTKVLPLSTIATMVQLFKERHPEILVVQTGVKNSMKIPGADRYAFNCKLGETAILLKHSMCHIDSEGGLVHMASQLSTPCVVSFGPTPVYYYGYPRNKNIVAPACNDCMSTTPQWSRVCPRGMQVPACMKSISPEDILESVSEILTNNQARDKEVEEIYQGRLVSLTEETAEFIKNPQVVDICIISPLNSALVQQLSLLKKAGKYITLFIPLEIDQEGVQVRTQLKKMGIKVEYGSALNIARPSGSFDVVFCQKDIMQKEVQKDCAKECMRLLKEHGILVWLD